MAEKYTKVNSSNLWWQKKRLEKYIGKRFGKLTVIAYDHDVYYYHGGKWTPTSYWKCRCDCGNVKSIALCSLISGKSKSCGCNIPEITRQSHTKHGLCHTNIYLVYKAMCNRCYNPNAKSYNFYGKRGITICDEWLDKETGFESFYKWSMENGYAPRKPDEKSNSITLDRIDSNGPYAPWNCRWTTMKIQQNNRRDNYVFYVDNKPYTLSQIIEMYQLTPHFIRDRYANGWCDDAIIYTILHPELKLRRKNGNYVDKDGFIRLIPKMKKMKKI